MCIVRGEKRPSLCLSLLLFPSFFQLRDSLKAVKDIVVKDLPCIKHSRYVFVTLYVVTAVKVSLSLSFQLTSAVRDALNMAGEFQMTDSR